MGHRSNILCICFYCSSNWRWLYQEPLAFRTIHSPSDFNVLFGDWCGSKCCDHCILLGWLNVEQQLQSCISQVMRLCSPLLAVNPVYLLDWVLIQWVIENIDVGRTWDAFSALRTDCIARLTNNLFPKKPQESWWLSATKRHPCNLPTRIIECNRKLRISLEQDASLPAGSNSPVLSANRYRYISIFRTIPVVTRTQKRRRSLCQRHPFKERKRHWKRPHCPTNFRSLLSFEHFFSIARHLASVTSAVK